MYHKWQSHDVWFLRYEAWQTEFFVIFDCFLLFYPPNNPKNQFWKTEKKAGDMIILHKCTNNYVHMLYCSLDMACNECNRYNPKNQNFKKKFKKIRPEISSFDKSLPKIMTICYTVSEIWYVMDVIILHFGPFFVILPP